MSNHDTIPDLERPGDARQRLLEAAVVVFAEKGFGAASVREICGQAGVNVAGVNYYFRDKESLYIEAAKHAHRAACGDMAVAVRHIDASIPPVDQLRVFIREMATRMHAPADPHAVRLMMREMSHPTAAARAVVHEFIQPLAFRLRDILRALLPGLDEPRLLMTGFSVMGQVLFYRQNRHVAELIFGAEAVESLSSEAVVDHVTRFTFAAIGLLPFPHREGGAVMNWVAIRMLTGDTTKYIGIVFGVAFAALLMGQQLAIFCGLMRNTTSQVRDIDGGDIWVMDKNVQFVDDVKPMSENKLLRVRGVPGVKWAVRLYKGIARGKLSDGNFQQLIVIGLDDATLVGAPTPERILHGNLNDLRRPNAVFIDEFGWRYLYKDEPFAPGKTLEMNDRRAVIVGMCKCNPTFQTFPILYCTYSQAVQFVPQERKTLTFILAKADDTVTPEALCPRIGEQTNLQGADERPVLLDDDPLLPATHRHPDQLRHHGHARVRRRLCHRGADVLPVHHRKPQAVRGVEGDGREQPPPGRHDPVAGLVVGVIGYGLGIGGAAAFGYVFENFVKGVPPAFYFGWQIPAITAGAVALIITFSALMSMRRVLFLEAGVVFR